MNYRVLEEWNGYIYYHYGKRSFGHAAPELWNSIPNDIKHAGTIEKFKTSLKTYLFKK